MSRFKLIPKSKVCPWCNINYMQNVRYGHYITKCSVCEYAEWGVNNIVSKGMIFDNNFEVLYRLDDSLVAVFDDQAFDLFWKIIPNFEFSKENLLKIYNSTLKTQIL